MPKTPYQQSAALYVNRGWSPVPMTTGNASGDKGQPLAGFTGRDGALVDSDACVQLLCGAGASTHPDVSVRAFGWVGIDVDHYADKRGADQLAAIEADLGKLPPTYYSTARGAGPSGIRFYRISPDVLINPEGYNFDLYGDSIEVVRFEHRYAKCWPTVHPNGSQYRWHSQQDGGDFELPDGQVPAVVNLAWLPKPWLDWLVTDNRNRPTGAVASRTADQRGEWDRVFRHLDGVTHFLSQHRARAMTTPEGSGFNQALNDYAHALSSFVPEFYDEHEATELCFEVCRHHFGQPDAADRATINSGLIRSRQPFYARRPTEAELLDPFSPYCDDRRIAALNPPRATSWLDPTTPAVNPPENETDEYDEIEDPVLTGRLCDPRGRVPGEYLDSLFSDPDFPIFGHLRQYARASRVSPVAALGVLLTRIAVAIPIHVVTPPLIGSEGSVNAFLCLLGKPGTKKGASTGAAAAAVDIQMRHTVEGAPHPEHPVAPIYSMKIGSGQGFASQFVYRTQMNRGVPGNVVRERDACLFTCNEVADMTAKSSGASTLLQTLCELWVAEPLGSAYVDPSRRLPVAGMSYRACFILHGQPDLMGPLLIDAATGGAPQRFVYLPVIDIYRPDNKPERPDPISWSPPIAVHQLGQRHVIKVCDKAVRAIENHDALMSQGLADPLDGHALFAQLKTAVAINACRGTYDVDDRAWHYAGRLHKLSKQTRDQVIDYLRTQKRQGKLAVAKDEGEKELIKAQIVQAAEVDKSRARILEVLGSVEPYTITKRDIQLRCSRKWDAAAFDLLCVDGTVVWKKVPSRSNMGIKELTVYALSGTETSRDASKGHDAFA